MTYDRNEPDPHDTQTFASEPIVRVYEREPERKD